MNVISSNILSCPEMTVSVPPEEGALECTLNSTGETQTIEQCTLPNGNIRGTCTCVTPAPTVYKTPCGAFSDGFNYTTSALAILFGPMLLIVLAIKIMRFAGEDG